MEENKDIVNILLTLLRDLRQENKKDHIEIRDLILVQNGRIRKLENWRKYLTGIAVGVGLFAGFIGKYVMNMFIKT